jgi:hypothetical protein
MLHYQQQPAYTRHGTLGFAQIVYECVLPRHSTCSTPLTDRPHQQGPVQGPVAEQVQPGGGERDNSGELPQRVLLGEGGCVCCLRGSALLMRLEGDSVAWVTPVRRSYRSGGQAAYQRSRLARPASYMAPLPQCQGSFGSSQLDTSLSALLCNLSDYDKRSHTPGWLLLPHCFVYGTCSTASPRRTTSSWT